MHAAALREQPLVVVIPARARQGEHPLALGEAPRRIRRRVDEDVAVVECRDQADVLRQQHRVAEHVARHVADACDGEVLRLRVPAELTEMAADRFPAAAGGDRHVLVVVPGRAAGGKGVAEPESVLRGNCIRNVRELRGALVGGDDEVGIVAVVPHDCGGRPDLAALDIVGDVEQCADEPAIALGAVGQRLVAAGGRAPRHEAALGADRHDHRVLDVLCLHEAEDLGAEVVAPVGPAQAAASDAAHSQVHALDTRRMHEDLEHRLRQRNLGETARIQLEREERPMLAAGIGPEIVRPQGRVYRREIGAQYAVVVDPRDAGEQALQRPSVRTLGSTALGCRKGRGRSGRRRAGPGGLQPPRCSRAPPRCKPVTAGGPAGRTSAHRCGARRPRAS